MTGQYFYISAESYARQQSDHRARRTKQEERENQKEKLRIEKVELLKKAAKIGIEDKP